VAGQRVLGLPNHTAGAIWVMNEFYFAAPPLPNPAPWPGYTAFSEKTKMSLRHYYGKELTKDNYGYIQDVIWTSCLVPDYAMRLIFLDE